MAIAYSKFSLGLPTPEGESRFWEKSTHTTYACLIYSVSGKTAPEIVQTIEIYLREHELVDAQSLYEVVSTIETRCREKTLIASVVGVLVDDQQLYLASLNGGVFLVRGSKRGAVLSSQPIVQVIQGTFKQSDVLIIYTDAIKAQIHTLLSKSFAFDQIQTLAHEFQRVVRKMNHSEAMAVAFIASQKDSEVEVEEITTKKRAKLISLLQSGFHGLLEFFRSFVTFALWLIGRFFRMTKNSEKHGAIWQTLLHPKKTYVGVHIPRKKLWIMVLVIVGTLLITITSVVTHAKNLEIKEQLAASLTPYQQSLSELQIQAQTEPAQAYLGVQQLIQELTVLESQYQEPKSAHKEVLVTLQQAQTLAQKLLDSQAIDQLPIFDDLRTISPTFITTSFSSNTGRLLAIDAQQQYLVSYSLVDKRGTETVLDSTNGLRVITSTDKMFLALGNGVFALSTSDNQVGISTILESSDAVKNSQLIGSYENFVYLLSAEARAIFRYELKSGTLVNRATWIGSSSGVPFSDVTTMVVDGDIWVGSKDGQIIRMRSGKTVDFSVTGLTEPFDSTLLMATSIQSPLLYVLEPKKSRLVVLKKDTGEVVNQVQNRTLGSANNIVYDESRQLVLVVSGSILYRMPL